MQRKNRGEDTRAKKQKGRKESPSGTASGERVGMISINTRGVGYIATDDSDEDIEIHGEYLNTALNGDEVSFTLSGAPHRKNRGRRERPQGAVLAVIRRAKTTFVGTVDKDERGCFVVPDDRRVHVDFLLPAEDAGRVSSGYKVQIGLARWTDPKKNPLGALIAVIGKKGEHAVEMEAIVRESGFETGFPRLVEEEAARLGVSAGAISAEEYGKRRDFRDVPTCTIDPENAKDFDDALSFRELPDGSCEVGIHIADASHYVREDTALDREAQKRATSIYLVDRTIPMLPETLSNHLCSLNPNEDKLTFSALFTLDRDARVRERWFGKSVIRSRKRFTYAEAENLLRADADEANDGKNMSVGDKEAANIFRTPLRKLNSLARILRARRHEDGAVEFESEEVAFELEENGVPIRVYKKERGDSNKLIEEFMLLANREVAGHIRRLEEKTGHGRPFVYRVHDEPNREKIEELAIFVRAVGHEFEVRTGDVSAKDIRALFERIAGHASEALIKKAALRAMAKAVYSTTNIGHYGLACGYYTHFTSPIRRYPDIMVHRLLDVYLSGASLPPRALDHYHALALHSSEKEVAATEAERASIKYKQVEYLQKHIGKEFDATISGVTEWGMYVEEDETRAEGMIRLRSLTDDFYELDVKNYALRGTKGKKKYALGDRVRVRLAGADLDRRTLDFTLAT